MQKRKCFNCQFNRVPSRFLLKCSHSYCQYCLNDIWESSQCIKCPNKTCEVQIDDQLVIVISGLRDPNKTNTSTACGTVGSYIKNERKIFYENEVKTAGIALKGVCPLCQKNRVIVLENNEKKCIVCNFKIFEEIIVTEEDAKNEINNNKANNLEKIEEKPLVLNAVEVELKETKTISDEGKNANEINNNKANNLEKIEEKPLVLNAVEVELKETKKISDEGKNSNSQMMNNQSIIRAPVSCSLSKSTCCILV